MKKHLIIYIIITLILLWIPSYTHAQEIPPKQDSTPQIELNNTENIDKDFELYWNPDQSKPVLLNQPTYSTARRLQIAPQLSIIPNDDYYNYFPITLITSYHFTDFWAIELQASITSLATKTRLHAFLIKNLNDPKHIKTISSKQLSTISLLATYAPFYGKWAFHNINLNRFSWAFLLGPAITLTKQQKSQNTKSSIKTHFAITFGTYFNLFFLDWLALRLDTSASCYKPKNNILCPVSLSMAISFFTPKIY